MADDAPMANKRKDDSLEIRSDDLSENSVIHAATKIQSSVKPEDYPAETREAQVDAAGARPEQQRPSK